MDEPSEEITLSTASMSVSNRSTSVQRTAATALQKFSDEQVIAWLTLLRCLQPGYQHCTSSHALASHQIDALSFLKVYSDEHVLELLRTNQRVEKPQLFSAPSNKSLPAALVSGAAPCLPRQVSFNSIPQSSSSSLGPWSHYSRDASITSQGEISLESSRRSSCYTIASSTSFSINNIHTHWCTACEKPKPMMTCDGWKRHMKEHETVYICMPQGPVKLTEMGPECVFCGMLPDKEHLDTHSIQQCLEKPRSYKRKANFNKHLEAHGVSDTMTAEQWQFAVPKKYFSCGFCIAVFYNINDQLNHIDYDHYRKSEDIFNWNFTKVIKGLLLQPGMDTAWQSVSADYQQEGFSWDSSTCKSLQLRLELAEESVQALSMAVLNESLYDWSYHCSNEPDLTMSAATPFEDRLHDISVRSMQERPIFESQVTSNISQDQVQKTTLDGTDYSELGPLYTHSGESSSKSLDSHVVMDYQHDDHGKLPPLFPRCDTEPVSLEGTQHDVQTVISSKLTESIADTPISEIRSDETEIWRPISQ